MATPQWPQKRRAPVMGVPQLVQNCFNTAVAGGGGSVPTCPTRNGNGTCLEAARRRDRTTSATFCSTETVECWIANSTAAWFATVRYLGGSVTERPGSALRSSSRRELTKRSIEARSSATD